MDQNILVFTQKYLESTALPSVFLSEPFRRSDMQYDLGLRAYLYSQFDYERSLQSLLDTRRGNPLVFLSDIFGCTYCILRLNDEKNSVFLVGPYCQNVPADAIWEYFPFPDLPPEKRALVQKFFREVPKVPYEPMLISLMTTLAESLYGKPCAPVFEKAPFDEKTLYGAYSSTHEQNFSLFEIEHRYDIMGKLLNAVKDANVDLALHYTSQFNAQAPKQRFSNALMDTKKWLVIFNTSLRLTAEQAKIHPYHLDDISTKFSFKIEAITDPDIKFSVMQDMVRQYCDLIERQNVSNYSLLVQKVLILIAYDLSADLSLSVISHQVNANASYLSNLCKREVGTTLTEYVTLRRIQRAQELLRKPKLQIKDIAQQVGICDLAYFTRLFKKQVGMSPSEYRRTRLG